MEPFDISSYLKSIVGGENYRVDQAIRRFQYSKQKNNAQVTAVWALVLAVLNLEEGEILTASQFVHEAEQALVPAPEEGLTTLCRFLNEKIVELGKGSNLIM